jgi:hypothetical protein
MRKIGWIMTCLVVLLSALALVLYRPYQIQPLPGYPFDYAGQHHKRVDKATSLFCRSNAEQYPVYRVIIIQLIPLESGARPLIKINKEEETWTKAQERLTQIYSTRAARVIFLVDNADVEQRYRSELMDTMRQSPVIDDVCVIDPKNPPSWYPPPEVVMPSTAKL